MGEQTPLLGTRDGFESPHSQFCTLVGVPPSYKLPAGSKRAATGPKTLYGRALRQRSAQTWTYNLTAALSNTLLLSQVVLGAALTALGASESSHVLITIFGATNTIIAGLVAYLKSRGEPMRARMFRDDLERVVDEIENSEVMWLGISRAAHGYDAIDTDDEVNVRSEVARLTRLYDKAVRTNTMNNPDMYMGGSVDPAAAAALRARAPPLPIPAQVQVPSTESPSNNGPTDAAPLPTEPGVDPDESPASARPKPATQSPSKASGEDDFKTDSNDKQPVPEHATSDPQNRPPGTQDARADPDESPASALPKPSKPSISSSSENVVNPNVPFETNPNSPAADSKKSSNPDAPEVPPDANHVDGERLPNGDGSGNESIHDNTHVDHPA